MAIDQAKLDRFLERFVADLGAVLAAPSVVLGDRLGLYKALAAIGPATPAGLAARTGTHERYVTEWLRGQAAGGYVTYDPAADRYLPSEEQAFTLADETSPAFQAGARVADVGCGHGASTILMATAWPKSSFVGFDYHRPSIERARKAAADAGVGDRCTFEVAAAADYPGEGYGLVAVFDALHDLGDRSARPPTCAARWRPTAPSCWWSRPPVSGGGQPQPGRARLLLGVDADLRAERPVPGRAGAGQPGAGGAAAGAARPGRLRQGPPRRRDPVQPRAGGAPVAARAASRSAAHSFQPSASSGASSRRGARARSRW
jgi:SAM-dependent methyltransferase